MRLIDRLGSIPSIVNMLYYPLFGMPVVLWLASLLVGVLAVRVSRLPKQYLAWVPIILSLAVMVIGYVGFTRFHFEASQTVNGAIQWRFDSRWVFLMCMIVGAGVASDCLWRLRKTTRRT